MSSLTHLTKSSFAREVYQSEVPVLIDFYADWCGPCRMLAPVLERLAVEFAGRAKIVKVDVDAEPDLANQFQVSSIPTLAFFANGELVSKTAGLVPEGNLRHALNQLTTGAATEHRVG